MSIVILWWLFLACSGFLFVHGVREIMELSAVIYIWKLKGFLARSLMGVAGIPTIFISALHLYRYCDSDHKSVGIAHSFFISARRSRLLKAWVPDLIMPVPPRPTYSRGAVV